MKEISIGVLTLLGEQLGAHVHVTVLGDGLPGQRPLCGKFTVTAHEWLALADTAAAMVIDERRHQANLREIARLDGLIALARQQRDRDRAALTEACDIAQQSTYCLFDRTERESRHARITELRKVGAP